MSGEAAPAQINRPQLKSTVIAVPLSGNRLALHRGPYKAEHQLMVLDDPGGLLGAAVAQLDGTRTIEEIAAVLRAQHFPIDTTNVRDLVDTLAARGVVADAQALSTAGLGPDAAARYSRNLNAWAALTSDGRTAVDLQRRLGGGHVLVLGVGGVGTCVALPLAMAGCGRLTLVDFDTVELQNLNRQVLYTTADVGRVKVDVAKAALQRIDPDLQVSAINARLTNGAEVRELIESVRPDFVSDAIDRPTVAIDRWVNDACFALGIPYSANSVSGHTALLWTKVPGQTGCFECDDLWAAQKTPDHYEVRRYREHHDLIAATSAFSFTAMVIGALTASDIVRSLVAWPLASAGRAIVLDFSTLTLLSYDRPPHPDCHVCGSRSHSPRPAEAGPSSPARV